jgi:hypothetical protein
MKTHINNAAKESKAGLWGFKGQWAVLPVLAGGAAAGGIALCQFLRLPPIMMLVIGIAPFALAIGFVTLFINSKPKDYVTFFGRLVWRKTLSWAYWRQIVDTPQQFVLVERPGKHPRYYYGVLFLASLSCLSFDGCVSSGTRIATDQTASAVFRSKNSWRQKLAFKEGYALGGADVANRMYWDMYRPGGGDGYSTGDGKTVTPQGQRSNWSQVAPAVASQPKLKRKLLSVPVPAHRDPEGTDITEQNRTIEIVQ